MKSSSGEHFIALDHVRAAAAFMVFTWHFIHYSTGYPVPFQSTPNLFLLAILDEGHTGVALFMTLSGYLFARLLNNKTIILSAFLWNRLLRLFPLLAFVLALVGIQRYQDGQSPTNYLMELASGLLYPTLPNGGWSITIEFHFYLILPLLLWSFRKSPILPIGFVVAAILFRAYLYFQRGEIQLLSYFTIVGRIDQFTIGILAFNHRILFKHRHTQFIAIFLLFLIFWWWFDRSGGFFQMSKYPSPSKLWIILPTLEGIAYASAIAWYDTSFNHQPNLVSLCIARFGEYSYSIYLLHFFVVFRIARFIHENVMDISNFYIALFWSAAVFCTMFIPSYLSFRFIESPFLKYRKKYSIDAPAKKNKEHERCPT